MVKIDKQEKKNPLYCESGHKFLSIFFQALSLQRTDPLFKNLL